MLFAVNFDLESGLRPHHDLQVANSWSIAVVVAALADAAVAVCLL